MAAEPRGGGALGDAERTPDVGDLIRNVRTDSPSFQQRIGAEQAGTRLDRFLAQPLRSRTRAAALIDAGDVTVDGRRRPKRHVLATGEVVIVASGGDLDGNDGPARVGGGGGGGAHPVRAGGAPDAGTLRLPGGGAGAPEGEGVAAGVPYAIAYEDEHLLVIDKPAGVVVHPGAGNWTGTLAQALSGVAAGGPDGSRAGIVHRLDRDTSGLIVVARSDVVHRALTRLLARRALRREYLALVDGRPEARTGTIDAPIGRDRRDRTLHSIDTDVPRDARTHFEIERTLPSSTLLRVVLETGRTHQIRVHLAAIGHPVCGDRQYGAAGRYGLQRQFLHAAALAFPHPVTGAEVGVRSALPADLIEALRRAQERSAD